MSAAARKNADAQRESLEQGSPSNVLTLPRSVPPATLPAIAPFGGAARPAPRLCFGDKPPGWEHIRRFAFPFR
jgi:hypothetical protein